MVTAGHYGQEEITTRLGRLSSMWAELKVTCMCMRTLYDVVCGCGLWVELVMLI